MIFQNMRLENYHDRSVNASHDLIFSAHSLGVHREKDYIENLEIDFFIHSDNL